MTLDNNQPKWPRNSEGTGTQKSRSFRRVAEIVALWSSASSRHKEVSDSTAWSLGFSVYRVESLEFRV